ncbi:MAG TPA: radical SAM family heme chaperone HemW [Thermoanaerobaculia bacterium]|nr:radical SAM family heme chaperone HemW [Thermoanaerobaculia bacterium]
MLGLYIHLPFCRVHCAYCPFVVSTDAAMQDAYVDALVREITTGSGGEEVDTIYFGGGTPSRTPPEHLQRIVNAIRSQFSVERDSEFTIEANPEDVTVDAMALWKSLGINRLSMGVQSFNDAELQAIGRIHGSQRARDAIRDAITSGVRTSVDLILGLPDQTADSFRASMDEAIGSGVGHLSVYMLDLDEETALKRRVESGVVTLPPEELIASLYVEMVDALQRAGFSQYEISNFARCGEESKHNLRYWRRQHYHGFGVGAHSFIGERRFANTRDLRRYIAGDFAPVFSEELTEVERRHESAFLQLRQSVGINCDDLLQLCGKEAVEWIENGVNNGWLRREGVRVAFTPEGFLVSSELISQLF